MDELWSFVGSKQQQVWIWLALDRATRKIIGVAFGDRSAQTCQRLWDSLPPLYRQRAVLYTDYWDAYAAILPSKRHRPVAKGSGETNHIERFNNTLRQRCSGLVRKTLSFSRNAWLHEKRIRLFIKQYNAALSV
jgi:IS1 family transposase